MQATRDLNEVNLGYGQYGSWKKNVSPQGMQGMPPMAMQQPNYGFGGSRSSGRRSGSPVNKKAMDDPRKIFVGALPKDTTKDKLEDLFGEHGEITDCYVVSEPKSGRGRGFGFVRFKTSEAVDAVLEDRPYKLADKTLIVKRVLNMEKPENLFTSKKLFVGGLKGHTEEDLQEYFSKFGTIEEVSFAKDKAGNNRKFAMITFDDYDPVDKVMGRRSHHPKGGEVGCRKFLTKEELEKVDQARREHAFEQQAEWAAHIHGFGASMMDQHRAHMGAPVGPPTPLAQVGQGDLGYGAYGHLIGKNGARKGMGDGKGRPGGQKPSLLQRASLAYDGFQGPGYGQAPQGFPGQYGGPSGDAFAMPFENKFIAKLEAANVSPEGISILARENLLNPDVLASLNVNELNQVPLKVGDRQRIRLVLNSIGYGG